MIQGNMIEGFDPELEEWREVYKFPKYSVSNYGRIVHNRKGDILVGAKDHWYVHNYCIIGETYLDRTTVSVKKIVMEAFYKPIKKRTWILNVDGDSNNNSYDNLCIVVSYANNMFIIEKDNKRYKAKNKEDVLELLKKDLKINKP